MDLEVNTAYESGSNAVENNAAFTLLSGFALSCSINIACRTAVTKGGSELLKRAVAMVTGAHIADKINDALKNEEKDNKEHTKGKRNSTKGKHEKGRSRNKKDKGGEKGDVRRPYKR